MPEICMIVAADKNLAIGKDNKMPWHLPADLKFFKKTTSGYPVLMGRKTYDSIGKALPGRRNLVISRSANTLPDAAVYHSIEEAVASCETADKLFIIGGEQIFRQCISVCDTIYLTQIDGTFDADTWFPPIDADEWKEVERSDYPADEKNAFNLSFVTLKKRAQLS